MSHPIEPLVSTDKSHASRSRAAGQPSPQFFRRMLRTGTPQVLGLFAALMGIGGTSSCNSFDPVPSGPKSVRVAPVDSRTPVVGEVTAAPIMGGNLLSFHQAAGLGRLLASDPARDRISIVAEDGFTTTNIETGHGSRPNRATEDANGFAHVVLRGSSELVMIHPSGEIVARSPVCASPRGLAFDSSSNELVVACAEGALVRHSVDNLDYRTLSSIPTDSDVRDVVVQGDRIYVSRLRSAEVLEFRGDELVQRHTLPSVVLFPSIPGSQRAGQTFSATVAWRMVAAPNGDGVVVLHQRSLNDEVGTTPDGASDSSGGDSSYGGNSSAGCDSIVQAAVSEVKADGTVVTSDSISGVVLAVDMVVQQSSSTDVVDLVMTSAGTIDFNAPRAEVVQIAGDGSQGGSLVAPSSAFSFGSVLSGSLRMHGSDEAQDSDLVAVDCGFLSAAGASEPTTSIVGTPDGLAVLQREPAVLLRGSNEFSLSELALGGSSVLDSGHEIFHRNSGGGIACASCHPEAGDDGHVWNFADVGLRKTQFLGVPLAETAPFHWDGSLPTLGSLMDEVFVVRMGGVFQSPERLEVLGNWMSTLRSTATDPQDPLSAARGQALFESSEVGCASCHSGDALTDNKSYSVGTSGEERLQVPPLNGLVLHPPYMHNGCAKTLEQRFDPACGGGDAHGKTSQLNEAQVGDLVAYMKTL